MRFLVGALVALSSFAAVVKLELVERKDYADGRAFGKAGGYEFVKARAYFAVDPNLPQNKGIVDLHLAPRNAQGMVEFSADVEVLKPWDSARGNGTAIFQVSNRGGRGIDGMFHRADSPILLEQGYTVVWCGWQWDISEAQKDGLRLYAPIATDNGKPIRGPVRAEWVPSKAGTRMWLGDRNHVPYKIESKDGARLTVRDDGDGARRDVPAAAWTISDGGQAIEMSAGFEAGRIYELVYTASNPRVAGLGPAAIRDLISFLRYRGAGGGMLLNDQPQYIKRTIAFGVSQSGRFLRKYLYDGFNADEKGRIVFDGVWAHVAGAGRGSFNHRFAQASRDGHPRMNFFYPTDLAPFDDASLLAKSKAASVVPKVFFTDGSYEYWGRGSALTHSSTDGTKDVPLDASVRRYFMTGTQHGAGAFPPRKIDGVEHVANSNDYRFLLRGLLVAMNNWITTGKEPPKSAYPSQAKGELVAASAAKAVGGVKAPAHPHRAYPADYGPEFESSGIITKEPPELGKAYAAMMPAVDADGNEVAGVRLPQVAVPLAAYTGWNYRTKEIGAAGEIFDMVGGTFPFSKSRIAALYRDKEDYVSKTYLAARELVKGGYVLEEDLIEIVERAKQQWDFFTASAK